MSASEASVVRDLTAAERRSPAEQEQARLVRPQTPAKAYYSNDIRFPGYGYPPQRCQHLQPVGFCRANGHVALGRSSCGTRRCPDHWRDWLEDAVIGAVARLAAYRHVVDGWEKRLVHASVSAPQNRWYTKEQFWDARSESNDVAKDAGIRGGMLVPHPYRASDAGEELFATAVEHGDWPESRGKYALFREVADDWDEMLEYIEEAPHAHVLGPSEDVSGEDAPSGWVVKNIRSLSRFEIGDMDGYRDMATVAYYVLTHAAVQEGRNTVSWFGEVHGSVFDPSEELTPAEWAEIQNRAERAVRTREDDEEIEEWHEELECPHPECESIVEPIERLHEFVEDDEWMESLDVEQRHRIRGLEMWRIGDLPPPHAHKSKDAMRAWLEEKGRVPYSVSRNRQSFVSDYAVSS